jgi:hypothetical protein
MSATAIDRVAPRSADPADTMRAPRVLAALSDEGGR